MLQYSVALRNARGDALETELGAAPILKLFTGAQPATCALGNSGTELLSMTLPADAMTAASAGVKGKNGTWSGLGIAVGDAAHFRLYKADGTTCVSQGSVGVGIGDLQIDNDDITVGQLVTITAFNITEGNP